MHGQNHKVGLWFKAYFAEDGTIMSINSAGTMGKGVYNLTDNNQLCVNWDNVNLPSACVDIFNNGDLYYEYNNSGNLYVTFWLEEGNTIDN